ncbi:zinc finger Y-chromosomal protein-like [Neocloeon triangulifer]|uniref:zinc finger Y-chromosomal protein-like n=1 Tax=Neocloeon triangulifer TaxID=2078957 RepID=UPI00286F172E|nr:zinc finger Y-chromosomal protein-like [Neocloeon triangulifer]
MWPRPQLCRLCERPANNGGFPAAEVDSEKFDEWCLNYLGTTLAAELKEDDLICYFCVWDARCLHQKNKEANSTALGSDSWPDFNGLCWWPSIEQEVETNVKILFDHYKAGHIQQCWVQLENIIQSEDATLVESEDEIITSEPKQESKVKCVYCYKISPNIDCLRGHIKNCHDDIAIKCDYTKKCSAFFRNYKEKESHIKEFHLKSKEKVLYDCIYCPRRAMRKENLACHVRERHAAVAIRCPIQRCSILFKTQDDLTSHLATTHLKMKKNNRLQCSMCEFKTNERAKISHHEFVVHNIGNNSSFKCPKCSEIFITKYKMRSHFHAKHNLRTCPACNCKVPSKCFNKHKTKSSCRECGLELDCCESRRQHEVKCRKLIYNCGMCPYMFRCKSTLKYHINRKHLNIKDSSLRFKHFGLECKICCKYFSTPYTLNNHLQTVHSERKNKFQCAHCSQEYMIKFCLINHLAMVHDLLEKEHECEYCTKRFYRANDLKSHIQVYHSKKIVECRLCNRMMLKTGLK